MVSSRLSLPIQWLLRSIHDFGTGLDDIMLCKHSSAGYKKVKPMKQYLVVHHPRILRYPKWERFTPIFCKWIKPTHLSQFAIRGVN